LKLTELDREALVNVINLLTSHLALAGSLNDKGVWQVTGWCPDQPSVDEFMKWADAVQCVTEDVMRKRDATRTQRQPHSN
jgi:hypothetical protein